MPLLQDAENEELLRRIGAAYELMEKCRLCPRECFVNRLKDEKGFCGMGREIVISSYGAHYGEEDVLVGLGGSGTIFFTGCNLGCLFCQNYDISHARNGYNITRDRLSEIMLTLEKNGCHNINFVTPTHFVPQIMDALVLAKNRGLDLPLVFNCGGYESIETLRLLKGIIDIYMPDVKFADSQTGEMLCHVPDYADVVKQALLEMHSQVGDLELDRRGIAVKGLLVRHLVMPNGAAGSREVLGFIADEVSRDTYVNIMAQYRPLYEADRFPELNRGITSYEYKEAVDIAREAGLHRGFPVG
jgi:putative pyruvate formate lyase activating enzyme